MKCPNCGKSDIRFFEHVEQHRIIEIEDAGTLFLSRPFPQDDSVVKEFLECTDCGWQKTPEELEAELHLKIEKIE